MRDAFHRWERKHIALLWDIVGSSANVGVDPLISFSSNNIFDKGGKLLFLR